MFLATRRRQSPIASAHKAQPPELSAEQREGPVIRYELLRLEDLATVVGPPPRSPACASSRFDVRASATSNQSSGPRFPARLERCALHRG
jgi:hypothetical protein